MPLPFSLFSRKKSSLPFKDYYTDWFNTLEGNLLPLLRQALSSSSPTTLSSRLELLLHHLLAYYDTLDLVANSSTVPLLIFPSWRNSLETPFLFLGDLHPYLFTNLLRSFIDRDNEEDDESDQSETLSQLGFDQLDEFQQNARFCKIGIEEIKTPCKNINLMTTTEQIDQMDELDQFCVDEIENAWKNPSKNLMARIEQIECGLRLMVPALTSRVRRVQGSFVARVAVEWVLNKGKTMPVDEAVNEEMEELAGVFLDANRLRRSVIMEIVGATSLYQGALFLEGLAQFLVGFKDQGLLAEFERCRLPNTGGFRFGDSEESQ